MNFHITPLHFVCLVQKIIHTSILGTKTQRVYEDIEQMYQILSEIWQMTGITWFAQKCIYTYTYCRNLKNSGNLSTN